MTDKELLEKIKAVGFTEEQEKQIKKCLGIKENKKWKPEQDERYYFVDSLGEIEFDTYYVTSRHDEFLYHSNNMFKTKEEAEFRLEQIKVYNELKNFADENNKEIDWNSTNQIKHSVYFSHNNNRLFISDNYMLQEMGQIYFSSPELAQQAITTIGADRIKKYLFGVE